MMQNALEKNISKPNNILDEAKTAIQQLENDFQYFYELGPKSMQLLTYTSIIEKEPLNAVQYKKGLVLTQEIYQIISKLNSSSAITLAQNAQEKIFDIINEFAHEEINLHQTNLYSLINANNRINELKKQILSYDASIIGMFSTLSNQLKTGAMDLTPAKDKAADTFRNGVKMAINLTANQINTQNVATITNSSNIINISHLFG